MDFILKAKLSPRLYFLTRTKTLWFNFTHHQKCFEIFYIFYGMLLSFERIISKKKAVSKTHLKSFDGEIYIFLITDATLKRLFNLYVRFSENWFYRLRTTFTGDPVDWKKRQKNLLFEFWSGTRSKKSFDNTMSELRLRQTFVCVL